MISSHPVIIQARMGSSRLPGKVLMPLGLHGKLVLDHVVERSLQISDWVCVATSDDELDDEIYDYCEMRNYLCLRGPHDDVYSRYVAALHVFQGAAWFWRVTGDCPMLEPMVASYLMRRHKGESFLGMDSTVARGISPELIESRAFLRLESDRELTGLEREHVTMAMPGYSRNRVTPPPCYESEINFELNTWGNYQFLKRVFASHIYPNAAHVIRELTRPA